MSRELDTTGPPFRGAPLAPVLVPPTPIITVRDEEGELLLEVRSGMRGFRLVSQLAVSIGMGGLAFAVSAASLRVSLIAAGLFAIPMLVALRRSTVITTLRLSPGNLTIEESGLMHSSVQRIPLGDLEVPLVGSRVTDDGREYSLLLPRPGTERRTPIRLLIGHQQEHLMWLAEVLTKRMVTYGRWS